jgi:O-antigen/teichoic acid export membrane protein
MSARRDSVSLTVASVVNGAAAYAVVVVAGRGLDTPGFAAFSVAWSVWALCVAVLVFPVQHWIIWRSALDGGTARVRRALPRVLGLVAVVLLLLWLAGSSDRLFPRGEGWGLLLVLIGGTSAVLGLGRGALAALGRYRDVAWVLGGENVLRLLALVGVLLISSDPQVAVLTLAFGVLVLVPFTPNLRFGGGDESGGVRVFAELGALAGATAVAQVLVQFPPAYAEWLGEPPQVVAALFATFSLGRAPLLVLLAVSTRLMDPFTRFFTRPPEEVRPVLRVVLLVLAGGVVVTAVLSYLIGPQVVALFFGPERALDRLETALVGSGLALAAIGVLTTLGLMAKRSNRLAVGYWLIALAIAIVLATFLGGIPVSFFISQAVAVTLCCATLWWLSARAQSFSG